MKRKATAKTAEPAPTPPAADSCDSCKGEGVVALPATRRRRLEGESAICLDCLGSGLAS